MNVRTKTEVTEETRHREPLTRDRIIEAALRVMDAEGLEAVTMRRIGRELGVEAMSLYNHVEDKDDILEGVTERVMNEFEFPPPPASGPTTPERCLASGAGSSACIRASASCLAERHKPLDGLATFRAMDSALGVLRRAGLSARDAAQAFNALGGYILGFVMMEQGLMLGNDDDHAREHDLAIEALQGSGLVNVMECFPFFADCTTDQQFDFGLDLMIRGIQAGVDGS